MKILYVTTISNTLNSFLIPHMEMLIKEGFEVHCASNIVKSLNPKILELGIKFHKIPFSRTPFDKENYQAYCELKRLLKCENFDVIHTHTPVASAMTRLASAGNSKTKIIYTAHGFHFAKGYSFKNWIIFYPVEYILSKFTDVLITINKEDYLLARKKFRHPKKIYIPGVGIDTNKFQFNNHYRLDIKKELKLDQNDFVLFSIGELNNNKNHLAVIKALKHLVNVKKFVDIKYIIAGDGKLRAKLEESIEKYNLKNNVLLLGHRNDIFKILSAADIFIFPSKREGLPVSIMEAISNGLPIIASNIRGNRDLVEDGKGGILIDFNNTDSIIDSILKMKSKKLRANFSEYNYSQRYNYDITAVLQKLKDVYLNLLNNMDYKV